MFQVPLGLDSRRGGDTLERPLPSWMGIESRSAS